MTLTTKRLFVLRHGKGGAIVRDEKTQQPLYYSNKPAAKQVRDTLGGTTVVSYGPDHRKFKGE